MPTIWIDPQDFADLYGAPLDERALIEQIDLVKGEFKGTDPDGRWRIELNDTNRPDLWSVGGIARQLRAVTGHRRDYPFFNGRSIGEIRVDERLRHIRPYVAAFVVRGLRVTDRSLAQIIQSQEKLAENYGRKRRDVAIGVYNFKKITFPISYQAVEPAKHRYVPLGFEEALSLQEILERHPKGIEYRDILRGHDLVPLLQDSNGLILSMPPIINSRELGEVVPGDSDLFVEATGTSLYQVILSLNIMACDLADRGGRIERVLTVFPFDTPMGNRVEVPCRLPQELTLPVAEFGRLLGISVNAIEVNRVLECYGCEVHADAERLRIQPPPTRLDYLHAVDAVEDFAIARGYSTFEPHMPRDFTPGRSDALSHAEDKVRDHLVGMGYEETISNILVARSDLRERMNTEGQPLVEVANVMNENYNALRDAIVPSLLKIESHSPTAAYPHRLFETGDVAIFDRRASHGSRTELHLGALSCHRGANLAEVYSDLEYLLYQLKLTSTLKECAHPWFLPGRAAEIVIGGKPVGLLGELHPEVLTRWQLSTPAAAFEIALGALG
jgi:phenylalanyl-tRNA synthetase beta chain